MECELSLDDIHKSIDLALVNIREKHEKVDTVFGDLSYLKRTVQKVLEPLCERVGLQKVACLDDLRKLSSNCSRSVRPNSEGTRLRQPTPPSSGLPLVRALSDGRLNGYDSTYFVHKSQKNRSSSASQVSDHQQQQNNEDSSQEKVMLLPSNFHRTFRYTHPTNSENVGLLPLTRNESRTKAVLLVERRKRMIKISNGTQRGMITCGPTDIKFFEINRLIENFEHDLCILKETFSSFTQRILLPLQTFCKQCKEFSIPSKKERPEDSQKGATDAVSLGKTEIRIVQTLNHIKQLLWPSDELKPPVHLFSSDHFSSQVGNEISCTKYPLIRLIPDVLQKFNTISSLATFWLKRDIMYIQCTKLALLRAHNRFLKTERLWRQARDEQRRLKGDLEDILSGLQSSSARLKAVGDEIDKLNFELDKSNRAKKVLEEKLVKTDNVIEPLVAKHRSLRKNSVVLSAKIEARERSHEFLQSRVLSLKADQSALDEKLRINQEYASKLQDKMEELYSLRDAWSKRYDDKTDPETLRSRLQLTKIRMPLPLLREKTFTLRTEEENVERAVHNVERYLIAKEIHWSELGSKLPWTGSAGKNANKVSLLDQLGKFSDEREFVEIERRILSTHPEDEEGQRSLMFRLWMDENRNQGDALQKLLQALRLSDLSVLADSIERKIM